MSHDRDHNAAEAELMRWALEYARVQSCKADLEPGKFVLVEREDFHAFARYQEYLGRPLPTTLVTRLKVIRFFELDGKVAIPPKIEKPPICGEHVGGGELCQLPPFHTGRCPRTPMERVRQAIEWDDSPATQEPTPLEELEVEQALCNMFVEHGRRYRCGLPMGHPGAHSVVNGADDVGRRCAAYVNGRRCIHQQGHSGDCERDLL